MSGVAIAQPPCGRCGTALEREDLRCAVCGLPIPPAPAPLVERAQARIVRCRSCNAAVAYRAEVQAPGCAFCGSVMELEVPVDPVEQAEAAVPFELDPARARQTLTAWLGSRGFFRPSALASEASVESLRPLWWPAWVCSAEAEVSWAADSDAGARRADWRPYSGKTSMDFRELLIPASRGLSLAECRALLPGFAPGKAVAGSPEGPPGVVVERFELTRTGARQLVLEQLTEHARARLQQGVIPGRRHRKVSVSPLLTGLSTRRVSLPTYVLAYRYRENLYRVLIHGQDPSCVVGEAPLSPWKVALAVAAGIAAVLGILLLALRL